MSLLDNSFSSDFRPQGEGDSWGWDSGWGIGECGDDSNGDSSGSIFSCGSGRGSGDGDAYSWGHGEGSGDGYPLRGWGQKGAQGLGCGSGDGCGFDDGTGKG